MRPTTAMLALTLAAAACSSAASEHVLTVKTARSLVAEWALVNREATKGRVTSHYAEMMRDNVRSQLVELRNGAGDPRAPGVADIDSAIRLPGDADAHIIEAIARRLSEAEAQLEPR